MDKAGPTWWNAAIQPRARHQGAQGTAEEAGLQQGQDGAPSGHLQTSPPRIATNSVRYEEAKPVVLDETAAPTRAGPSLPTWSGHGRKCGEQTASVPRQRTRAPRLSGRRSHDFRGFFSAILINRRIALGARERLVLPGQPAINGGQLVRRQPDPDQRRALALAARINFGRPLLFY